MSRLYLLEENDVKGEKVYAGKHAALYEAMSIAQEYGTEKEIKEVRAAMVRAGIWNFPRRPLFRGQSEEDEFDGVNRDGSFIDTQAMLNAV